MLQVTGSRRTMIAWVVFLLVTAFGFLTLGAGDSDDFDGGLAFQSGMRKATGAPQLVSVEPLPGVSGVMCEWEPVSAYVAGAGLLQQQRPSGAVPPSSADAGGSVQVDRAPVRMIKDTYPTYSTIAVDTNSNEVYLQDENLFGYKVFNRLDNTPPTAEFSEPKRMVGGILTLLEFNCGLYVDPKSGDVYSVNNDTIDTLAVFPRDAAGNVAPKRKLHTPHGTYGIAVDEEAQELFLTAQHTNEMVVYRKAAEGEEHPIRRLMGDETGLEDPHGIAVDTKSKWIFVSNHGNVTYTTGVGNFQSPSITVYAHDAEGNTPPLRTIEGPKTQLNWPAHIFVDQERGDLFVANDSGDSILVFRTTDGGDVAPTRVLRGPKTGLRNPTGLFVDSKNDELWVSNMGNHSATVYLRTANGDVPPLRTIRSAPAGKLAMAIGNPGAAGYDTKRDEILVPN